MPTVSSLVGVFQCGLYTKALNAGDHLARPEIARVAGKMQEQRKILDRRNRDTD